jgi:hypothetical protein
MLDVTCHTDLETTYLKALEELGEGGQSSRRLLAKFRFDCSFRIQVPN